MLRFQRAIAERESLRVTDTRSAASIVATRLDPEATTLDDRIDAIEDASPAEIDRIVGDLGSNPGFTSLLSTDFSATSASADATIGLVSHEVPAGLSASTGTGGESPLTDIQTRIATIEERTSGEFIVFGSGILSAEFTSVILDSLLIVVPAAALLILGFLIFAYRDPFDLALGVVALLMAIVWTFGFMGLAGIAFSQLLVSIPVLLLAVGIDFGIHVVNRYREERYGVDGDTPIRDRLAADDGDGEGPTADAVTPDEGGVDAAIARAGRAEDRTEEVIRAAMRVSGRQLLVAFFIVTGTTVLGFGANATSDLGPIRNFGIVAAIGIIFTFLIFGVFLPALKVWLDTRRARTSLPRAGVDTTFSQEDFLPPEDLPGYVTGLPEPFAPGTYTVTGTLNYLEDRFQSAQDNQVVIYVEGPMRRNTALESLDRLRQNPPESFVVEDRRARADSVIGVIESRAERDPAFGALVDRNDRDDDGIPDDNLGTIYDRLFASPAGDQARRFLTEDYRGARIVFSTESDATQSAVTADATAVADRSRMTATPTGQTVVFQAVSDVIFASAFRSLLIALGATAVFLVFIYGVLEGRASLGLVNLVPIVATVAALAGTMRYFGIPFNALTATVLSIAIGLGVDYSAHLVHRFSEEYESGTDRAGLYDALDRTVRGTGGALLGSMLTTSTGTGVLALAITPILGQFGLLIALAVFYSFLTAVLITPSVAVVWHGVVG
ncbi:RND transporter [Halobacteriales archaeon SW_7_68_16]|nr:MAG: RND transporter [Halobacteriales archaeon SW_7_68_16]